MPNPHLIEIEEEKLTGEGLPRRIGITRPTHAFFYAFLNSLDTSSNALITVFQGENQMERRNAIITNLPNEFKSLPVSAWNSIKNDSVALTIKSGQKIHEIELSHISLDKLKQFYRAPQSTVDSIPTPKTLEPLKMSISPIDSILKSIFYISTEIAKTDKSYSTAHLIIKNVIIHLDGSNFEKLELIWKEMNSILNKKNTPSFFSCFFKPRSNQVKPITLADKFISKIAQIDYINESTALDFIKFAELFKSPNPKIFPNNTALHIGNSIF